MKNKKELEDFLDRHNELLSRMKDLVKHLDSINQEMIYLIKRIDYKKTERGESGDTVGTGQSRVARFSKVAHNEYGCKLYNESEPL